MSLFARLGDAALADAAAHGLTLAELGMGLSCAHAVVAGPEGRAIGTALTPGGEAFFYDFTCHPLYRVAIVPY